MHPRAPKHDALKLAKSFDYPPGYSLALGGAGQDQKKLFTEMLIALLRALAWCWRSSHVANPAFSPNLPYDAVKDLARSP